MVAVAVVPYWTQQSSAVATAAAEVEVEAEAEVGEGHEPSLRPQRQTPGAEAAVVEVGLG